MPSDAPAPSAAQISAEIAQPPSVGTAPPSAILLAAGHGSRMKSRLATALHPVAGQPLIAYPAALARSLECGSVTVVIGAQGQRIRDGLGADFRYVEQETPTGSCDAALAAVDTLTDAQGPVLVLLAGAALLTPDTTRLLVEQHVKTGRVTALLPEPGEEPAVCVVDAAALRALRERRTSGSSDGTLLAALQNFGATIGFFTPEDLNEALVVRTRIHLAAAIAEARARILEQHMLAGVTVEDPSSAYIDAGVTIGQDTVIRPTTFLEAGTVIGEGCEIGPCARIANCTLGDRVSVQNAVLADSTVGDDTRIGPFAQLRPGSRVGRKVKIGNFVELKKAEVEDRVSLGHFAYMGDVFVGEKTNIGAGTITCNYDGKHKHVTRIGRNAFIGSNATLVAPVEIGEGGFVAAGSVVTEAVPDDALALGRARQINKPEWAKKRRERE